MKKLFIFLGLITAVSGFTQTLDSTMNFCFGNLQSFGQGNDRSRPRIFDFDKDGDKDFAILELWNDSLAVYINNGVADFTIATPIRISIPANQVDLAIGDIDGDTYTDVATISNTGDLSFFQNNSGTGLTSMGTLTNSTIPNIQVHKIEAHDFNNDGLIDIIGTYEDLTSKSFYGFTFQQSVAFSYLSINPFTILSGHNEQFNLPQTVFSVADFDSDGFADIVVGSSDMADTLEVYLNAGTTSSIIFPSTASTTFTNPAGGFTKYIIARDYNSDGFPDIAVSSQGGFSLNKNTGTMSFNPWLTDPSFFGGQFDIADLNSNNKVDLISGNMGQYIINPGTSTGSPNFSIFTNSFYVFDTRNFDLADFDGNSTLDILFTRGQDYPFMYISRNFSFYVQEHITSTNTVVCGSIPVTFSCSNSYSAYPGNYNWTPGPASGITYTAPTAGGSISCSFSYTLPPGLGQCVLNTDTIYVNSQVIPTAAIATSATGSVCAGTAVTLNATVLPSSTTYTWSTGASTPAIVVSPTTTTTYSLFMDDGCLSTGTFTVDVSPNPTVNITAPSTTLCAGDSLILTANGANSYTWTPSLSNSTTFTVKPTSTSVYTLVGATTFGCSDTTSTTITVNATPTVNITASKSLICYPDTVTLNASGAASYTWSTGSNSASIPIIALTNTTYSVVGSNGCKTTSVFTLSGFLRPNVTVTSSKPTVCNGDSITLKAYGAASYSWAPVLFIGNSFYTYPTANTTYSVFGQSTSGCYNYATVSVSINVPPVLDILASELCIGKSATFTAVGANTYTWNTGSISQSISQTPPNSTPVSFTVVGVDASGCRSTVTKTFDISNQCSLIVWNGVTPNGDGLNDFFLIENIEQYPGNRVFIYNRWGQLLETIDDYNNTSRKWNGSTTTNVPVPSGTYFYTIDLKNGSALLKGYIELTKKDLN